MRGGTLVGINSGKPASITGDRAQGEAKTGLRRTPSKCERGLAPIAVGQWRISWLTRRYRGKAPSHRRARCGSGLILAEQPLHARIQAAFDLGFDMRSKVVDHILHDQL